MVSMRNQKNFHQIFPLIKSSDFFLLKQVRRFGSTYTAFGNVTSHQLTLISFEQPSQVLSPFSLSTISVLQIRRGNRNN